MHGKSFKSGARAVASLFAAATLLVAFASPASSETVHRRDFSAALQVAGTEIYLGHLPGFVYPAVLLKSPNSIPFLGSYTAIFEKVTPDNETLRTALVSSTLTFERITDDRGATVGYVAREEEVDVDPQYDRAGNGFRLQMEVRERDAHTND